MGILFPQSRAPLAPCLNGCVAPWKAPAPVGQRDSRSDTSCTCGALGAGGGAAAAGYRSQCLNTPLCLTVESRPAVRAPKYILLNYI